MLLLVKVKFLLEVVLGLTKDEGWNVPRSLAEAREGSSLAGVVWTISSMGLGSALVAVGLLTGVGSLLEMAMSVRSSFLDLEDRSSGGVFDRGLVLLLKSLDLPGAGDDFDPRNEGSRGGRQLVSRVTMDQGPLWPFSLIERMKSEMP